MSLDRQSARQRLRAERRSLPAAQRIEAAHAVASLLAALPQLGTDALVAGYWACDGELPLHALLARRPDLRYLLPKIAQGKQLSFVRWSTGELLDANRFGIPEPAADEAVALESITAILMPLIGFSRRGDRLGSGGGYYDRTLAPLLSMAQSRRPLLIGVGYGLQELTALGSESWDVPMDYVATERELIDCRQTQD